MQREEKGGAFARNRVDPDAAAVPGDDAFDDAQTNARPAELVLSVQAIEGGEKPIGELHVETAPMATANCSTYGRSNCSRQDGRIMTMWV